MKVADLFSSTDNVIVVFTRGDYLKINPDGTGTSGNWPIAQKNLWDKIIVYLRNESNGKKINEIWVGIPTEIIGPVGGTSDKYGASERYLIKFIEMKKVGTTHYNWKKFASTGSRPVRYFPKK